MFPNVKADAVSFVLQLCGSRMEIAVQILLERSANSLLNSMRSRMQATVRRVVIDSNHLLDEVIQIYKNPEMDITVPLEITYQGE